MWTSYIERMDKIYLKFLWIIIAMRITKGGSKHDSTQIKHVYAKYGDPVILKCLNNTNATSWDGPSLKSSNMYNETPYADKDQIVQDLPNAKNFMVVGDIRVGEYNLKIIKLTQKEEGYYKCNAHIENTLFEIRFLLKIKAPPIILSTNADNGTLIGTTGEQMNITCRVRTELPENETKINITMYHKDQIVEESENHVIVHTLVPNNTHNRNIFKCVVDSLLLDDPVQEMIVLNIKYRPTLRFDRNEQSLTVYEGTYFSLTCLAESNPVTTEIFWKTDGQQIKQEFDLVKQPSSDLLNIENLKRKHEGNYTCVAQNEVGNVNQSIYIKVLCFQVNTEMTNISVIVSISVITAVCILSGIIIFLAKDKLKKRPRNTSDNGVENNDDRDDIAVENQLYQSRDEIADDRAYPQSNLTVGELENREESSGRSMWQDSTNSQTNNGLNYAEISFTPGSSVSRFVVHGKENMTVYSDVVLPLSSSAEHLDQ